ncbi:MAG: hypothetical protein RML93_02300, partial [Anaerolineales bacterium]|nr:hypothetical protein [Anaerolineales bacterium]MDW8446106.1 hypothetical protein [Anaerolineales bacterium]
MLPQVCKEFLELIKLHLSYLFEQFGFAVVHWDKTLGSFGEECCLIVLQSEDCRVKLYKSQGEVNLQFGPLSAPMDWRDQTQGVRQWYYIRDILSFLRKEPLDINKLFEKMQSFETDDQQLAELSRDLQPVCERVINLFRKGIFEQWQDEYKQWREEREREFQKQYAETQWTKQEHRS